MRRLCLAVLASGLIISPRASAEGWPSLAAPLPLQGGGEKDAALIIGVEKYMKLPPVPGAADNARAWYSYLTGTLGVDPAAVQLLLNEDASREYVEAAADKVSRAVKPGGTVWLVYIGHGAPGADGKDGVLVGYDAQQSAISLYARSLAQRQLLAQLEKGAQARTLLVIDACFSGRSESGVLVPGLQPVVALKDEPVKSKRPVIALTAGRTDQFAGPLPGGSVPAFSYLALGGLRGWADADGNGVVTAREVVGYANRVLSTMAKDRTQNPEVAPEEAGTATLARVAKGERGPPLNELVLWLSQGGRVTTSGVAAREAPAPPPVAAPLFGSVCDAKNAAACREQCGAGNAGSCALLGALLSPAPEAVGFLKKGCDGDDSTGCFNLGLSLERGLGAAVDLPSARQAYGKGCRLGSSTACALLGTLYRKGLGGAVDKREAASTYQRGCDLKSGKACVALAEMLAEGEGILKDVGRAERYFVLGCDNGYGGGCDGLGAMLANGAGLPADEARALELFDRACSLRWGSGCANAGALLQGNKRQVKQDLHRASSYFLRACELNEASGCTWAGIMMAAGNGVPTDAAGAHDLVAKGCRLGDAKGCELAKLPVR